MKRLSAITLSLLLLWVQAFVLAQPAQAREACTCCECNATCCVTESSAPIPQSPAPSHASQFSSSWFALNASLAWTVPRGEAEVFSSAPLPLLAARTPLFERDCALLI